MNKLKELIIYDINGDTVSRDTFIYVNELKEENKKLKQENEKLKKALEFYADEYSYDLDGYCGVSGKMRYRCVLNRDREERNDIYSYAGKLARQTLKEIEESK